MKLLLVTLVVGVFLIVGCVILRKVLKSLNAKTASEPLGSLSNPYTSSVPDYESARDFGTGTESHLHHGFGYGV